METINVERFCRSCRKRTPHQKEVGGTELGVFKATLAYLFIIPLFVIFDPLIGPIPVLNFGIIKPYFCQICGRPRYF
ncbi:MAG: hypothetical protein KDA68_16325 [Planctomycetaceae bacterium]|nr:hypothetical protein [Planctomycetaceae bacterium]